MEKNLKYIAKAVSGIFTPLMSGTYAVILAMLLSYLAYSPLKAKLVVMLVTFLGTCIVPVIAIFVLWKIGVVKEPALNSRRDRMIPYMVTIAGYLAVAVYTHVVNAPLWLTMTLVGAATALIVDTVINVWWKISGHMTGMGGLCAVIFFLMLSGLGFDTLDWEFLLAIGLAGVVGTSRLLLSRHSLWQVVAGFGVGFFMTLAFPWLFN